MLLIDQDLWSASRAGARAGRGFRYQDAVAAWLSALAWAGDGPWSVIVPEGVEDATLHGTEHEYRAQVKSRHDPRGRFGVREVATHLLKTARTLRPEDWVSHRVRLALVLERPIDGLLPAGWNEPLVESGQDLTDLTAALQELSGRDDGFTAEAVLDRAYVVVNPEPLDVAVGLIAARTGMSEGLARLIAHDLRLAAGAAADANYLARADQPSVLDASIVQARIDAIGLLTDPTIVEEAVRLGLVEVVDFAQPLEPSDFYSGVDVLPGHVAAGLVFERPEPVTEALTILETRRAALVSGPSGAGKSALAWLCAYATRHVVRWYRVRRLAQGEVHLLARLALVLEAGPERPVGFVFDDVGRDFGAVWDAAVRELGGNAGVLAVGTVREEDLFTLVTSASVPVVRPRLDEALAERLWRALKNEGQSAAPHWLEPYELSLGLLLEYTHLLTRGHRLSETLDEQVRRRLAEGRDDELLILRTVSFASAHGAGVQSASLRFRLELSEPAFGRALRRLIDEHALREDQGLLGGLHQIRSSRLEETVRDLLDTPVEAVIADCVAVLRPADFPTFITRVLRRWPDQDAALVRALAQRLPELDAFGWAAVFRGLALATADQVAVRWVAITRELELDDTMAAFTFTFALAGSDFSNIESFALVHAAVQRFDEVAEPDLRRSLLDQLDDELAPPQADLDSATELAAALTPLGGVVGAPNFRLILDGGGLAEAPLQGLLTLMQTVRELDARAAAQLADSAGGVDVLLERVHREVPWVTRPSRGEADGLAYVAADVRSVSPEVQPDLHADVVDLCDLLLAAAPEAELVISRAVAPNGEPVAYKEYEVASKRMPRSAAPPPSRVAWNRAQLRAVQRLVGAETQTERLSALNAAIRELSDMLAEAGEFYCRLEAPPSRWRLKLQLRQLLTRYIDPAPVDEGMSGGLDKGEYAAGDDVYNFASNLHHFLTRLFDPEQNLAALAATAMSLANDAQSVLDSPTWRWVPDPPTDALRACVRMLSDIRVLLGELREDGHRTRRSWVRWGRTSRRHPALPRAAEEARAHGCERVAQLAERIKATFEERGFAVEVVARPPARDEGWAWPAAEAAVLVRALDAFDWVEMAERFGELATLAEAAGRLGLAPVIKGQVVAALAATVMLRGDLMPDTGFAERWQGQLPLPLLVEDMAALFARLIDTLTTYSVAFSGADRELNQVEQDYLGVLETRLEGALQEFTQRVREDPRPDYVAALSFVTDSLGRLVQESNAAGEERAVGTLGSDLAELLTDTLNEFNQAVVAHRLVLLEHDLGVLPSPGSEQTTP